MDKNRIEIGDIINVYFSNSPPIEAAVVIYIPQATGDSWVIRRQSETIVYFMIFERLELFEKAKEVL
jgi:hypothetical protein